MLDRTSTEASIYTGCSYLQTEISQAVAELNDMVRVLKAAAKTLDENFKAENMAGVKLAAESIRAAALHANAIMPRKVNQIAALSGYLANTFGVHLRRRHRHD